MNCPNCNKSFPEMTTKCECGYIFKGYQESPDIPKPSWASIHKKKYRIYWIFILIGIFCFPHLNNINPAVGMFSSLIFLSTLVSKDTMLKEIRSLLFFFANYISTCNKYFIN